MLALSLIFYSLLGFSYTLNIELEGLENHDGSISYLIFASEEGFPENIEQSYRRGSLKTIIAKDGFKLEDIEAGTYSLSLLHDENDNKKVDKNFLGLPKEGFAFSNNPTIYFGPPSFSKAKFEVKEDLTIKLKVKYF